MVAMGCDMVAMGCWHGCNELWHGCRNSHVSASEVCPAGLKVWDTVREVELDSTGMRTESPSYPLANRKGVCCMHLACFFSFFLFIRSQLFLSWLTHLLP
jgi:hypothetical protein